MGGRRDWPLRPDGAAEGNQASAEFGMSVALRGM